MKKRVYIIEYRFWDKDTNQWISKVSQEGYFNYADARKYCEERGTNAGRTEYPLYFQNQTINGIQEEYFIHDVLIR